MLLIGTVAATPVVRAGDTTPPTVTVTYPNGGQSLGSDSAQTITWTATDDTGILGVDVLVTFDDGVTWSPLAKNTYDLGELPWFVPNRPTATARIRVIAYDFELNAGADESDANFTVVNTASGRLNTTLRDFDAPGTQPLGSETLIDPGVCSNCHGFYDSDMEPYFNWRGSMMAWASHDPLFKAALHVSNQDAPESGDTCIRCHTPTGWYGGRSHPTDGSALQENDKIGVNCAVCHMMVDPLYEPGVNPIEDLAILGGLADVPDSFGNAQLVLETTSFRMRGPFVDAVAPHSFLPSAFHRDSAMCGSCHDVSNVLIDRAPSGAVSLNANDAPATSLHPGAVGAEQRTYSEWFFSAFNSVEGVYAPEFGGNRDYVRSCQDCHMRAITGQACFFDIAPIRNDLPLHDLTGAATWQLSLIPQVAPDVSSYDELAIQDGIRRARYMLQNAADMELARLAGDVRVRIINRSGHKLPTGYPEGRRMWINVKFYDAAGALVGESGSYNATTADLLVDPELKVYEALVVAGPEMAAAANVPLYTPHHLSLGSLLLKDNRIPPLGFSNSGYESVGAGYVGYSYADGQNWDDTLYTPPAGAVRATATLFYQATTKEYIEFLRDEGGADGVALHQLWLNNGKCPPELMVSATVYLLRGDLNCDGLVNNFDIDAFVLALIDPAGYAAAYPGCDAALADMNNDGGVNNFDIDPFVACLVSGICP